MYCNFVEKCPFDMYSEFFSFDGKSSSLQYLLMAIASVQYCCMISSMLVAA